MNYHHYDFGAIQMLVFSEKHGGKGVYLSILFEPGLETLQCHEATQFQAQICPQNWVIS